jgi:tetratricopeptide (TPR) repeat protein
MDSKYVKAWYGKGFIYARNKKVQDALEHLDKAIELDPDFEPAKESKKLIKAINRIP